jgi:hypothetical protein
MNPDLSEILRCPISGERLRLEEPELDGERVRLGWLVSASGRHRYPVRIPRFAPESNYADNFGMQWNRFRQTQLDGHSGLLCQSASASQPDVPDAPRPAAGPVPA